MAADTGAKPPRFRTQSEEAFMARVLLIEDDDTDRAILNRWLAKAGHEVAEAEDGKSGMKRCDALHPDVVVTDIFMPEADGIETTMRIVRSGWTKGVIAISGGGRMIGGACYLRHAKILGAREALRKPVDREALLQAVEAIAGA